MEEVPEGIKKKKAIWKKLEKKNKIKSLAESMRSCAETLVCRAALTVYITTYASFRALVYFYFSYWLLCITSQTSQVEIHSIFVVLCLSFLCFVSSSLSISIDILLSLI